MSSMIHVVPISQRPKVFGGMGGLMAIAQITGPLIGGAFTSHVTWRWCFYINLPIGGLALLAIFFFLQIPDQPETKLPTWEKIRRLDIPGTFLVAPGAICLLLALQWGGQTYPVSHIVESLSHGFNPLTSAAVGKWTYHCTFCAWGRVLDRLRRFSGHVS